MLLIAQRIVKNIYKNEYWLEIISSYCSCKIKTFYVNLKLQWNETHWRSQWLIYVLLWWRPNPEPRYSCSLLLFVLLLSLASPLLHRGQFHQNCVSSFETSDLCCFFGVWHGTYSINIVNNFLFCAQVELSVILLVKLDGIFCAKCQALVQSRFNCKI